MNREEYIRKNDLESHDVLSKTCFVSALVIFVICILNLLGIFILNKKSTCIACFLAMFFFCMPCILNKLIKNKGKRSCEKMRNHFFAALFSINFMNI